ENQIKADDIRRVLGYIDPALRLRFPTQVEALELVRMALDEIAAINARRMADDETTSIRARVVWRAVHDGRIKFPQPYALGPLREAMSPLRYDLMTLRKDSPCDRQRIAGIVDDTLRSCEAIMARWAYYYRKGKEDTFNSSQLLIPQDLPGPVVLDATASQN